MADKKSLLLVDSDEKSLRVLEVSLKKAGFNVTTARNGLEGLERVETANPDLIISDTRMDEMDGFEFCRRLKQKQEWADVPFIFLTDAKATSDKIKGIELGVEDYLTKPIYIKEILTRVKILLQKREQTLLDAVRAGQTKFAGTLADMTVVDLIQTLEIGRKSGVIHFTGSQKRRASVFFRNGKVIDAEVGRLQGAEAMYRLLTWPDGKFEVEFKNVRRKDAIAISSQGLLMEGMRRLDEWGRMCEGLPPLTAIFEVDYPQLSERLAEIPDDVNGVLRLFDGRRTLLQVVDDSAFSDLEALSLVAKLFFEGLIFESKTTPADQEPESPAVQYDAIQDWLEREGSMKKLPPGAAEALANAGEAGGVTEPMSAESGADLDPNEFADERRGTPSGEMQAMVARAAVTGETPAVAQTAPMMVDDEDLPLESGMFKAVVEGAVAEATLLPPPQRRRNTLRGLRGSPDHPGDFDPNDPTSLRRPASTGVGAPAVEAKAGTLDGLTPIDTQLPPGPRAQSGGGFDDASMTGRTEGSAVARIQMKKVAVRKVTEDPNRPAELLSTRMSGRRAGEDSFEDETPIPPPFFEEPSGPHMSPLQMRQGQASVSAESSLVEASPEADSGDEDFESEEVTSAQISQSDVVEARDLMATSGQAAPVREPATAPAPDAVPPAGSVDDEADTGERAAVADPGDGSDEEEEADEEAERPSPQAPRPYMLSSQQPQSGIPNVAVEVAGAFDSSSQRVPGQGGRVPTVELAPGVPQGPVTAPLGAVAPPPGDAPRMYEVSPPPARMRRISGEDALSRPVSPRVNRMRAAQAGDEPEAPQGGRRGLWLTAGIVGMGLAVGGFLYARKQKSVVPEPETVVTVGQPSEPVQADAGPTADAAAAVAVVEPSADAAVVPADDATVAVVEPAEDATVAVAVPAPVPDASPPPKPTPTPTPAPRPDASVAVAPPRPPREPKEKEPARDADPAKESSKALLDKARKASRGGAKDKALQLVDQVLKTSPRNAEAMALKANVLLDLGRSAEALKVANDALELDPSNADVWLAKGLVHYDRGQTAQARKAFERYLQLRPRGREADAVRTIMDSL